MASLCPGYKHVEAFGPDDEYEDEDDDSQVAYVTLDMGSIEPTLVPSSSTYRLIGLDTPTPFMQLSGTILKGRHDSLLGTELIFTDGKDPHDSSKKSITYVASAEQRICFREVRLQPKGSAPPPDGKGKGKEREQGQVEAWDKEAEAAAFLVDRVSGKNVVRARSGRRRGRLRMREQEEQEEGEEGEGS